MIYPNSAGRSRLTTRRVAMGLDASASLLPNAYRVKPVASWPRSSPASFKFCSAPVFREVSLVDDGPLPAIAGTY